MFDVRVRFYPTVNQGQRCSDVERRSHTSSFSTAPGDGTTATALKEQISVALRLVKKEEIHDVFMGFEELQGTAVKQLQRKC